MEKEKWDLMEREFENVTIEYCDKIESIKKCHIDYRNEDIQISDLRKTNDIIFKLTNNEMVRERLEHMFKNENIKIFNRFLKTIEENSSSEMKTLYKKVTINAIQCKNRAFGDSEIQYSFCFKLSKKAVEFITVSPSVLYFVGSTGIKNDDTDEIILRTFIKQFHQFQKETINNFNRLKKEKEDRENNEYNNYLRLKEKFEPKTKGENK
jgi:hypothetical protein